MTSALMRERSREKRGLSDSKENSFQEPTKENQGIQMVSTVIRVLMRMRMTSAVIPVKRIPP